MTAIEFIKKRLGGLEALLLIKGDLRAQRVLVAWTLYKPPQPKSLNDTVQESSDPKDVARVLWEEVGEIDISHLAALADIPVSKLTQIFWRLCQAGLIWPDGTVSANAQKILLAESNAYVADLQKRQK